MQLEPGYYVVGYYGGVQKEGNFSTLIVFASEDRQGYPDKMNFKPYDAVTGAPTIDETVEVGDYVAVSVYEDVQLWRNKDDAGVPYGETKGFVKRVARQVVVVA
jgi:hypothetical protein